MGPPLPAVLGKHWPQSIRLMCLRPRRADELDPPERSAEIEGLLGLDERRCLAAENPHMRVRRLFADEWRQHPAQTSELDFQHVVSRGPGCAACREPILPGAP